MTCISFCFCFLIFSEKVFISLSLLKKSFAGYKITGCLCFVSKLKYFLCSLLVCVATDEKFPLVVSLVPLHMKCFCTPLAYFKDFSLSLVFFILNMYAYLQFFFSFGFGLLEFTFYSSFRVTAILSGRQRDFPYIPCPHTHIQPLPYQHSPCGGAFVTTDESTLTHHSHPESIIYIRVHIWCCTFYKFGQIYKDRYPLLWYHNRVVS